jgi:hypothetical protein
MNLYEDNGMFLDEEGITVTSYLYPGHQRHIPYASIVDYQLIELGTFTGRHRLVGLGFRRPRNFFHWDRKRSTKTHSVGLDTGGVIHPTISPDDHDRVMQLLEQHVSKLTESS